MIEIIRNVGTYKKCLKGGTIIGFKKIKFFFACIAKKVSVVSIPCEICDGELYVEGIFLSLFFARFFIFYNPIKNGGVTFGVCKFS